MSVMCRFAAATTSSSPWATSRKYYAALKARGIPRALGGRGSLGHLSDPEGARQGCTRRTGPYRCALRHHGRLRRYEVSPRWTLSPGGARRGARSRPHDPDRDPRCGQHVLGVLPRLGDDGHLHGGLHAHGSLEAVIARRARGGRRRPRPTSRSMSTVSIRPMRPVPARPRSADSRRARASRCCGAWADSTSWARMSSRSRPEYDATTNTAQLAAQILFEEFALDDARPALRRPRTRWPRATAAVQVTAVRAAG